MTLEYKVNSKEDARKVIDCMNDIIDKWGSVTKHDLHDPLGLPSRYLDVKIEWTNTENIDLVELKNRWLIRLPQQDTGERPEML